MTTAIHALWRLAAGQPQLLAAHAASYAALVRDEGALSLQRVVQRGRLQALVFGGLLAGVVLAGVAVMLWATVPAASGARSWVLFVVPLLPLAAAVWGLRAAQRVGPLPLWAAWQRQVAADSALLHRVDTR